MLVKITKSSKPSYWYKDDIGKIFNVVEFMGQYKATRTNDGAFYLIDLDDCVIIDNSNSKIEVSKMDELKVTEEKYVTLDWKCNPGISYAKAVFKDQRLQTFNLKFEHRAGCQADCYFDDISLIRRLRNIFNEVINFYDGKNEEIKEDRQEKPGRMIRADVTT